MVSSFLLQVHASGARWSKQKIGTAELEATQVEGYLDLARNHEIDALVTISNQFAAVPTVHPLQLSSVARRKIELFHWSWMHVLTEASLLLANDEIQDVDQRFVRNEMVRFLTHPSTGVKGFDQMPASWTNLVNSVQAGAAPSPASIEARETIGAWHQVVRDLSLTMSRQLGVEVSPKIPREHPTCDNRYVLFYPPQSKAKVGDLGGLLLRRGRFSPSVGTCMHGGSAHISMLASEY